MNHPLTLEKIAILSSARLLTEDICNDMRAAYDLGRAEQLEECIQWIEYHAEPTRLINDLEEAMRPQENP